MSKDTCAICLENVLETDSCNTLCSHVFHLHCILALYKTSNKCPLCRRNLIEQNNVDETNNSNASNIDTILNSIYVDNQNEDDVIEVINKALENQNFNI